MLRDVLYLKATFSLSSSGSKVFPEVRDGRECLLSDSTIVESVVKKKGFGKKTHPTNSSNFAAKYEMSAIDGLNVYILNIIYLHGLSF